MSDQPGSGEREQAGAAIIAVPSFVSGAQELVVNAGDTVRLPCQVDRLQVCEKQYKSISKNDIRIVQSLCFVLILDIWSIFKTSFLVSLIPLARIIKLV